MMNQREVKKAVKEGYAKIAKIENACCAPCTTSCGSDDLVQSLGKDIGYTDQDMKSVPQGANLGLGCGNPTAIASLRLGDVVLDLGSGAGFDCFLASQQVGNTGKVIGVDMTEEMIEKAVANAKSGHYQNVEFRLGDIENLPVEDNSIDVVISNCVINLVPDKQKAFKETYRVLKPNGRMIISDIVVTQELPEVVKNSANAYIGCVSGAMLKSEYLGIIKSVGFTDIEITKEQPFSFDVLKSDPYVKTVIEDTHLSSQQADKLAASILSISIMGYKSES